jgi:uncharacterized protein DUF397
MNMQVRNGMPAGQLTAARWRKSRVSNPNGSCVEVAELAGGTIAVRNSRDPFGPALVYTRAEISAFVQGIKDGEFDNLIIRLRIGNQEIRHDRATVAVILFVCARRRIGLGTAGVILTVRRRGGDYPARAGGADTER